MYDVVSTSAHAGRRAELPRSIDFDAARRREAQRHAPADRADSVELSEAARDFDDLKSGRIREALVQRIRAEIAEGTYLTTEKIDVAVDRLHAELL
jgi:anti-sigma28 factor (negative regulator of flagellin synthesis)